MDPRPYQRRAVERALGDLTRGLRPCIVAPTGSGKTLVGGAIASRYQRPLWITHTQELVDQARARVPHCTVRSIQGLLVSGDRPAADLVVWDECHHAVSEQWSTVMSAYADAHVVGLTATPERGDGTALGNLFSSLVVVAQPSELIEDGFLVPADVIWPGRLLRGGVIADPLAAWTEHARGMRTIVYAASVEHAYDLAARWCAAGHRAACVEGQQAAAGRREIVEAFRSGGLDVLTNCQVLTEGFDVPSVECVVLACGCGTAGAYLQKVGRGMRPARGKTGCLVVDCKGSSYGYGLPDADREYSLTGRAIGRAGEQLEPLRHCLACGAVFAAPGYACPRCGASCSRPPTIQERQIRLEQMRAALGSHGDGERARKYRELAERGKARGYKPSWAAVQYKIRYGCWPDRSVRSWEC